MPHESFVADPEAVYRFIGRFFATLRSAGVEHVVVSPGSRSTPLAIAAQRTNGLRSWIELDERAAAFFALGLAKASGRPAVLVCTSGTAAANYLPAVVEAHYSRVPLIVATADRPPELRDWGAGQTIDQVGLYGRYPRWAVEVPTPSAGDDALRYANQLGARAVAVSTATPAGAVHLNWPLREPLAPPPGRLDELLSISDATDASEAAGRRGSSRSVRFSSARLVAESADVEELCGLARVHERGVICCGPMDEDPALRDALGAFASVSGWPVLADPASNLRSGIELGQAPLLDMGDVLTRSAAFVGAMRPEVLLRVGETPVSKAQRLWLESVAPDSVIWLDEGGHWGEPSHRATRIVRGGAASLLSAAAETLEHDLASAARRAGDWCRTFEESNAVARKAIDDAALGEEGWSGLAVAATVARKAPHAAQLFSSNSMSIRLLDLALANRADSLRVLCSRGASGIDGVTSTALGAAASASEGPTLLLTGDLAFLHDLSGLLLARREQIPLTIVVIDDNGGGIFSFLPIAAQARDIDFERLFHTPHEVDLARVAALFELDYDAADSVGALEVAIADATARPGVSIVHARVEAASNEARFRQALARANEAVEAGLPR